MSQYDSLFSSKYEGEAGNEHAGSVESEAFRILIVDDEKPVLKSLVRCFRKENYMIETCDRPTKALEILQQQKFHLIISDFKMPEMNGAELLKEVKNNFPETVRIMLTGHADTQAVMTAIKEGAVYKFILKPWHDDDLRVTVSLALEQYQLQQKNQQLQKENEKHRKELTTLSKMASVNRSQLLMVLNKKKWLSDEQVQKLLSLQMSSKLPQIKLLLKQGWVTEKKIREVLKKQFFIEPVLLKECNVDPAVASLIPNNFCRQQLLLPIRQQGTLVTLVMADPLDEGIIENLRFSSGLDFNIVMANCSEIEQKLEEVFGESVDLEGIESLASLNDPVDSIEIIIEDDENLELSELLEGTSEPPAIRLANAIILEAIRLNASDIHIQPTAKCILIRYRIDGVLHDKIQAPLSLLMALVSRIKIMAELDITERRRPQDGRLTVKSPLKIVDLRLSTMPTINGEKIVMRLLDRNSSMIPLSELGFSDEQLKKLDFVNTKPQGIILTTGPTGSGKTTTLYSLLKSNATSEKNYITIEDPVEYYMDMAGQVMVKEKIDLNFSTVLRAVLRQDPDTILLGEIRDAETANIAFQAALTGHVVYSTLHTNSALATLARLFDLGLRPYIVASALEAIVAQRLVRKLCQDCKELNPPEERVLELLGESFKCRADKFYQANGCERCQGTGLKGRVGLYEVLVLDETIRVAITSQQSFLEIEKIAKEHGLNSLIDDALIKAEQGLVSPEEILRVLGAQAQI